MENSTPQLRRPGSGRAAGKGSRLWSGWILPVSVLLFCCASAALLIVQQARALFTPGEAGYGDLYVYHSLERFQQTGVIYQDMSRELPSIYGPMLYSVLALPGRFLTLGNPLLGPRLIVLASFLLCIVVAASITRRLLPHRKVWLWSVLLALSFIAMSDWVLQLRGDFPAILLSLTAVRLLLSRRGLTMILLAGASAGFATLFKPTYVAALLAGLLWLAANQRWKSFAVFALGGGLTCIGIYAVFAWREPRMIEEMLVLRSAIFDYAGLPGLIHKIGIEPVALLGLSMLPFLRWKSKDPWMLLVGFTVISVCIGAVADLQVGGNVNYFFEGLFGCVPLATFAILKLRRPNFSVAGLFLSALLVINLALPPALAAFRAARALPAAMAEQRRQAAVLRAAFRNQEVLSFYAPATFFAPKVNLSDPFLLTHLGGIGKFDLQPLANRIRTQTFDLVVTSAEPITFRGIVHMSPALRAAIQEAYQPFCLMQGLVIFARRNSEGPVNKRLVELGCDASACLNGPLCRSW